MAISITRYPGIMRKRFAVPSKARYRKRPNSNGFSLIELVIVIAVLAILAAISLPFFQKVMEDAEVARAQHFLAQAVKECNLKIAKGDPDPSYTIPPNTNYFQFPDLGDDGKCLSPSSGNIFTAAQTPYGQAVSNYNLNINVVTGEKSTERNVPSHIVWE